MDAKPKRPISVWIAQMFLLLYATIFLLGVGVYGAVVEELYLPDVILAIVTFVFIALLCLIAFVGVAARKGWGRWLSVATFGMLTLLITAFLVDEPPQYQGPDYFLEWIGDWFLYAGLIWFPCIALFLRLLISSKVKAFFAQQLPGVLESEFNVPPPPPTFDS
jgi:hypothetical protein